MNAFEKVISEILWAEGYWVRTSVKVNLTKEEKRRIGVPSAPRWELDIVGYRGADNLILVVECKSYLDSDGVRAVSFDGSNSKHAARFKLFNRPKLRRVVFNRLRVQLAECGACKRAPKLRLALACGKIRNEKDRDAIRSHFLKNDWYLLDEQWIYERLERFAKQSYEDLESAVVSKLLLRRDIANGPRRAPRS